MLFSDLSDISWHAARVGLRLANDEQGRDHRRAVRALPARNQDAASLRDLLLDGVEGDLVRRHTIPPLAQGRGQRPWPAAVPAPGPRGYPFLARCRTPSCPEPPETASFQEPIPYPILARGRTAACPPARSHLQPSKGRPLGDDLVEGLVNVLPRAGLCDKPVPQGACD